LILEFTEDYADFFKKFQVLNKTLRGEKMKKTVVFLLALTMLAGLFSTPSQAAPKAADSKAAASKATATEAEWTVFVYLAADNNLCEAGYQNIFEMSKVGSTRDLNIVCLFDDDKKDQSWFVKVDKNEDAASGKLKFKEWNLFQDKAIKAKAIPEVNSGDPSVLYSFLKKGMQLFPARKYFLLFWNHGSGFYTVGDAHAAENGGFDADSDKAVTTGKFSAQRLQFIEAIKELDSIAYDDNSAGDSLTQIELKAVFEQLRKDTGRGFDIIGFDACLMNNVEVVSQLSPYAKVVIGSEESEPGAGWSYEGFLRPMAENPAISLEELSSALCKSYVKKSASGIMNKVRFLMSPMPITLAATDTVQMSSLEKAIDTLAGELIRYINQDGRKAVLELTESQAKSLKFSYAFYVDLGDLCRKIRSNVSDRAVKQAAGNVMKALDGGLFGNGAVATNETAGTKSAHGLSIFFPSHDVPKSALALYKLLDFSGRNRWDEMIDTLMSRIPSVQIGDITGLKAEEQPDGKFRAEVELISETRGLGSFDVTVSVEQFEGSMLMKLMQRLQLKKLDFEKNPMKTSIESNVRSMVDFVPAMSGKFVKWLGKNRDKLGSLTVKMTVALDNGYVLAQVPVRYSTMVGINAILTDKFAREFFGMIFGKLAEANIDPTNPAFPQAMASVYGQVRQPVLELIFPKSNGFEKDSLTNFLAYLNGAARGDKVQDTLHSMFRDDVVKILGEVKMTVEKAEDRALLEGFAARFGEIRF
jgi:hypothetical protein